VKKYLITITFNANNARNGFVLIAIKTGKFKKTNVPSNVLKIGGI
jgi:hypothetical protein